MLLRNRVALVIGGGSIASGWGIGKATSVVYAREGAICIIADVNMSAAQETAELIVAEGGRAEAMAVDVTDDANLHRLCSTVLERYGAIDILHCNVGLGKSGESSETSPDEWRKFADANLTSLHVATQAVLPSMRTNKRGVILVTSSIAGLRYVGYPHLAYGVTKAAAIHFARLVAVDNAPYGIRANAIVAGLIDTPRIDITLAGAYSSDAKEAMRRQRDAQVPLGHMGDAWDIAEASVFLASDKAKYITGTELVVDGGLSATVRQAAQ